MESQQGNARRVPSGIGRSSGTRDRSGSGASGARGDSISDIASHTDYRGSFDTDEDAHVTVDFHADEARILDPDYRDGFDGRGDNLGSLLVDDGLAKGTGAGTNDPLRQTFQHSSWEENQTLTRAMMKQSSHVIRSVEVDSTCCWDGTNDDEAVADVRIVMAIDSKPDTRLVLLDLDGKFVKTASFYNIDKLASTITTETATRGEKISLGLRRDSSIQDISGKGQSGTRLEENNHGLGCSQKRQMNGFYEEEMGRPNHNDGDGFPKFKKRRLFPIFRSASSKDHIMEIYNQVDYALSEPTILHPSHWPVGPARIDDPCWPSREWVRKSESLGKESRSTSGQTVQIHPGTASSSHSSAPSESCFSTTAEHLSNQRELTDQALSHRHCEACKLGGHRLPSGSGRGLPEGSNVKVDSGDKRQSARQTDCQPSQQEGWWEEGSTTESEMKNGSATKTNGPGLDKSNYHMDVHKSLAPYKLKLKSRNVHKTRDASGHLAFSNLSNNSSPCDSMTEKCDEVPTRGRSGCHRKLISSSNRRNLFKGSQENHKLKDGQRSHKMDSSFSRALQDMSNNQVNMRSPNERGPELKKKIQGSTSSLSPDISPGLWVRRKEASFTFSPLQGFGHFKPKTDPIPIKDEKRLEILFANDIASGTYLIEIEAAVSLSTPDSNGWRDFSLPGLLPLQHIDVAVPISFRFQSALLPPSSQSRTPQCIENPRCSNIPQAQFNARRLFDVGISTPTQISGKFRLTTSPIFQLRLKTPVYDLDHWNGSTSVRSFPRWSQEHGLRIEHHASLTMVAAAPDIFADRVRYSFLVKNGFTNAFDFTLNLGECLIEVGNTDWHDASPEHQVKVTVVRFLEDVCKPLELTFSLCYPGKDQVTVRLPTLSPNRGNLMSERIVLAKPPTGLILEYPESDAFSTWTRTHFPDDQSQATCFDRIDIPRLFPEGLKDDLVIRIIELVPVCFRALQREGNPLVPEETSNLVWNLKMSIDNIFDGGLECHMSFDIQAGRSDPVLTVNPHGWTPDLFIIDGQVATVAAGEWRKDRNGNLALLKLPNMTVGQTIRIALRWYRMIVREKKRPEDLGQSKIEYTFPEVLDKSVLGGSLRCNVDCAIHISCKGNLRDESWHFSSNSLPKPVRLPKLNIGHTIMLCLPGLPSQPSRHIRFEDEQPPAESKDGGEHEMPFHNQAAEKQTIPGKSFVSDLHPSAFKPFNPPNREKILLWVRYAYKLTWSVIRCAFTPFLLICALQFAVSRITHAWRPVEVAGLTSAKARHDTSTTVFRSMLNLGSPTMPWPGPESAHRILSSAGGSEAKELLPSGVMEDPLDPEEIDVTEQETITGSYSDPRHGEPTAEGMGVMDWIDRALGWKNIAQ